MLFHCELHGPFSLECFAPANGDLYLRFFLSLQEVVLHPKLHGVESDRNDHHDENQLEVWTVTNWPEARAAKNFQKLCEELLQAVEQYLDKKHDDAPHADLDCPYAVVNLLACLVWVDVQELVYV